MLIARSLAVSLSLLRQLALVQLEQSQGKEDWSVLRYLQKSAPNDPWVFFWKFLIAKKILESSGLAA